MLPLPSSDTRPCSHASSAPPPPRRAAHRTRAPSPDAPPVRYASPETDATNIIRNTVASRVYNTKPTPHARTWHLATHPSILRSLANDSRFPACRLFAGRRRHKSSRAPGPGAPTKTTTAPQQPPPTSHNAPEEEREQEEDGRERRPQEEARAWR